MKLEYVYLYFFVGSFGNKFFYRIIKCKMETLKKGDVLLDLT